MPSATIKVSFVDSTPGLSLASNDPEGTVQVESSRIDLKPSSSSQTSFDLTFEPDTGNHVSAVTGIEPGPPQSMPPGQGLPTLVPSTESASGEVDLQCNYPEGGISDRVIFSSTLYFTTPNGQEHHDPSIAFNPPD